MEFGTLATSVGLVLAIAAALDFIVSANVKTALTAKLGSLGDASEPIAYQATKTTDAIFGVKFFSLRSIFISVTISLAFLAISYVFAVVTSDYSIVWIFDTHPTFESGIILFIFIFGSCVGDIISIAQTRLFIKTLDSMQSNAVAAGLVTADAIISLSIFIMVFSITRMISYALIISTSFSGTSLRSEQFIDVNLLSYSIVEVVHSGSVRGSEINWLGYLAHVKNDQDASVMDEILRSYNTNVLGRQSNKDYHLQVYMRCDSGGASAQKALIDTQALLTKTIAASRGFTDSDGRYANLQKTIQESASGWLPHDPLCPLRLIIIDRTMSPRVLLQVAGISNALWASFERTTFDVYNAVAFKIASYVSIDPRFDIGEYYSSLIVESGLGFLGSSSGDPSIPYVLSEFNFITPIRTENLHIPFSPLLSSCLTISVLFWLYVVAVYASKCVNILKIGASKVTRNFVDVDRAPFTFLALTASGAMASFWFVTTILSLIWQLAVKS